MKGMERRDLESCRERLKAFADKLEALMDLIGDAHRLVGDDQQLARERYRELKNELRTESKRGATQRGWRRLTEAERLFYHRPVTEAWCRLYSPTNCVPGRRLFSELYDARINITHALHEVARQLDVE